MNDWRISPEDGYSIQVQRAGKWANTWHPNDLPDWTWVDDTIIILHREWFDNNYIEIKEWFVEQCLITHLTFEGSSKIHIKGITPELKTMFTLRWT